MVPTKTEMVAAKHISSAQNLGYRMSKNTFAAGVALWAPLGKLSAHRRRQVWGTGARVPIDFQQQIFSVGLHKVYSSQLWFPYCLSL